MTRYYLRKATKADAKLLLNWANDADTRRNSFNSGEISWEEHIEWFKACLDNPDVDIYICCRDGLPVGQVRLNCDNITGVISYSIAREARGQGIGGEIIRLVEQKARETRPNLVWLRGSVKLDNIASQKIFEKHGYRQEVVETPKLHFLYSKQLFPQLTIGIRVDANCHIATGHMMRCLSIAEAFRKTGVDCVFFVADDDAAAFAESGRFPYVVLNSQWDQLEPEADRLLSLLRERRIAKLLVDTYYATPTYLDKLRAGVKVIYIDDLNTHVWPTDMLINYNIYSELFDYPRLYGQKDTKLLLGCRYAPLRDEFRGLPFVCRDAVEKVLVTTGGTDPYNTAGELLESIYRRGLFENIEFHVIAGRLNAHVDSLKQLEAKRPGFVLHSNVRHMAGLMQSCDLAVTAGGSTLYELCACGLPSVTLSFADNQLYAVKEFAAQGLMAYTGDMRENSTSCIATVLDALDTLMKDKARRMDIAGRMRKRVDGLGATHIAHAIAEL